MGDAIYVSKFELVGTDSGWGEPGGYLSDSKTQNYEAMATEILPERRRGPTKTTVGIVMDARRNVKTDNGLKSLGIVAPELPGLARVYRKQWDAEIEPIGFRSLVHLELQRAIRPSDFMVGVSYIFPAHLPFRDRDEQRVHQPWVVTSAKRESRVFTFPFTPRMAWSEVEFGEKVMAAAISADLDQIRREQRRYTIVVRPDIARVLDAYKAVIRFEKRVRSKAELGDMAKWYEEDMSVQVTVRENKKPCAFGYVSEVRKGVSNGEFVLRVELTVAHQAAKGEENWSDWEELRNGELEGMEVHPLQSTDALQSRMEVLSGNFVSAAAKTNGSRAQLLCQLLGRQSGDAPALSSSSPWSESLQLLGSEQIKTAKFALDDLIRVVFQQAPPGTGKTWVMAFIIAIILKNDPNARILALAPPNIAVAQLVADIEERMKALGVEEEILALFSGNGKVRYQEQLEEIVEHTLCVAVDNATFKELLSVVERKKVDQYIRAVERNPRLAQEAAVGTILQAHQLRRVCCATLSFAEQCPKLFDNTTHIFLDEAGQAPFTQGLNLVFGMPALKKVLVTGDRRQLKVHLETIPKAVRDGFGLDSVIYNLDAAGGVSRTALEVSFRSHPHIVRCVERGFYRPHNERVTPGRAEDERALLTSSAFKLPQRGCPIVLVHQSDEMMADAISTSSLNIAHSGTAMRVIRELVHSLAPGSSIRCICLYTAQAADIERRVKEEDFVNVMVTSVDATQGHEADVTVVVTTCTQARVEADGREPFWGHPERVNVALSRARHGLVIIGDLNVLGTSRPWSLFLEEAKLLTGVVGPDFLDGGAEYDWEGRLIDADGMVVRSRGYGEAG